MRRYAAVALTLLVAQAALADQNPDIRVFLDLEPPTGVTRIDPEPNTAFNVYIVMDCFSPSGGLRGIRVAFRRTFGAICMGEVCVPGGMELGNVEDPHAGWMAAFFDCAYPDENGSVVVGYVQYYYTGPPGNIRIIRTEFEPGACIDCYCDYDYWCVAGNFGVGEDPPLAEPDCQCGTTAVVESSWSAIKAFYR
jgi:hypothetical protein